MRAGNVPLSIACRIAVAQRPQCGASADNAKTPQFKIGLRASLSAMRHPYDYLRLLLVLCPSVRAGQLIYCIVGPVDLWRYSQRAPICGGNAHFHGIPVLYPGVGVDVQVDIMAGKVAW